VTYNSNYGYQTFPGGCITILLLFIFGGNLIISLLSLLISPDYSYITRGIYNLYSESDVVLRMST